MDLLVRWPLSNAVSNVSAFLSFSISSLNSVLSRGETCNELPIVFPIKMIFSPIKMNAMVERGEKRKEIGWKSWRPSFFSSRRRKRKIRSSIRRDLASSLHPFVGRSRVRWWLQKNFEAILGGGLIYFWRAEEEEEEARIFESHR